MASLIRRLRDRSASLRVWPSAHLLVVVSPAVAVPVPDLGDRGHVDGVVDPPVPRSLSRWILAKRHADVRRGTRSDLGPVQPGEPLEGSRRSPAEGGA